MTSLPTLRATTLNRMAERQVFDRDALYALLDQTLIAHVAAVVDGRAAGDSDGLRARRRCHPLHLSTGAGAALRAGREAAPLAVSVCAVDALVYATTLYDSSMNYRSAVVHGLPEVVLGDAEKRRTRPHRREADARAGRPRFPRTSRRELAGTLRAAHPDHGRSV